MGYDPIAYHLCYLGDGDFYEELKLGTFGPETWRTLELFQRQQPDRFLVTVYKHRAAKWRQEFNLRDRFLADQDC
jgi:hypothetical protein